MERKGIWPVESNLEALRTELSELKLGGLSKRAVAVGVDVNDLEAAQDEGDKGAIVEMILDLSCATGGIGSTSGTSVGTSIVSDGADGEERGSDAPACGLHGRRRGNDPAAHDDLIFSECCVSGDGRVHQDAALRCGHYWSSQVLIDIACSGAPLKCPKCRSPFDQWDDIPGWCLVFEEHMAANQLVAKQMKEDESLAQGYQESMDLDSSDAWAGAYQGDPVILTSDDDEPSLTRIKIEPAHSERVAGGLARSEREAGMEAARVRKQLEQDAATAKRAAIEGAAAAQVAQEKQRLKALAHEEERLEVRAQVAQEKQRLKALAHEEERLKEEAVKVQRLKEGAEAEITRQRAAKEEKALLELAKEASERVAREEQKMAEHIRQKKKTAEQKLRQRATVPVSSRVAVFEPEARKRALLGAQDVQQPRCWDERERKSPSPIRSNPIQIAASPAQPSPQPKQNQSKFDDIQANAIQSATQSKESVYLAGWPGCGKTHTTREIVRVSNAQGRVVAYVSYMWATAILAGEGCISLHSLLSCGLLDRGINYYLRRGS